MKVYRIEHKETKQGPYWTPGLVRDSLMYYDPERCPGPSDDGLSTWTMTYEHHFGFAKMKQLFTWFKARDVFRMRKQGFRVYRYKVSDTYILEGNKQLAFVRAKATVREEVKMSLMLRHLCSFGRLTFD